MAYHNRDYYGNGPHEDNSIPPPPPQHRSLVNPEMSRGPPQYPGQQSYYSNNPNPFNDSNTALSQRSSANSSLMGGPGMAEQGPRHGRTEILRGYTESVHSGSSDSGQYHNDQFQRGHRSPGERGALMGNHTPYSDNPYNRYSSVWDNSVDQPFNPDEIADDGDDGLGPPNNTGRKSVLGNRSRSNHSLPAGAGAAGGAATGIAAGTMADNMNPHSIYGPTSAADQRGFERAQMLAEEAAARKRKRKILIALAIIVVLIVITVGVVAGVLVSRKDSGKSSSSSQSASQDDSTLLNAQSSEIQALMNNPNLHRVFPGIDYTPFNAQYPECLTNPPSQNNITRDMAVLSQMTNVIRLYGSDCNQTEMILESINILGLTDMKVWLAVWLDGNQTTNDRGMDTMYDILKRKGQSPFAGVIVGNEVLYRKEMTIDELTTTVSGVRNKFSQLGYKLPIAIADLGDNWTTALTSVVDVVMANVHPFFAGKSPQESPTWTLNFWNTHDVALTAGTNKKHIISEVGWPSEGGKHCGDVKCTPSIPGAVASIENMNAFMEEWICPALKNNTNYFWFEAFDEPWKEKFNTPDDQWETKWGLMDPGRNLKPGIKIPDCGGQTITSR